jgi:hypothetical protein
LERYIQASSSFAGSRECEFILALITCVEEESGPELFDSIVTEYDKLSRAIDSTWMQDALDKLRDQCGVEKFKPDDGEPDLC